MKADLMSLSSERIPIEPNDPEDAGLPQFHESHAHEVEDPTDVTFLRQPHGSYDLTLRVAPLRLVVPHEHYHARRVDELTERLLADGRLINPPIVAQIGEKYVVLDGATRLTAMRQLNCPYIVVQVVDIDLVGATANAAHAIELSNWNHVIYGGEGASLLATLRTIADLQLVPAASGTPVDAPLPVGALGRLAMATGESFVLATERSAMQAMDAGWLRVLNEVVECYGQWGNVERTLSRDVEVLASQFPDFAALVSFPRFTPQMILELAAQGRTVPAGITRFVIPGRILRLNAPLAKLMADEPLAAKQAWLDELLREKLRMRQVRFYEEPVVLLDE